MATMSTADLLDVFKNMTVLELNDFLKAFEEEFGVTAAAPVAETFRKSRRFMTVGFRRCASSNRNVTARLYDSIKGATIHDQVLDYRKGF